MRLSLLLLPFLSLPVLAGDGDCQVTTVPRGDSFACRQTNGHLVQVSLADVQAPGMHTAIGQKAQQALTRLLQGQTVQLQWQSGQAVVWHRQQDVAITLLRDGLLRVVRDSSKADYYLAESQAKGNGIGLWQPGSDPDTGYAQQP